MFFVDCKIGELFVMLIWIGALATTGFNIRNSVSSTIYARTNENVTFKWSIQNDTLMSDMIITKQETGHIVILLDVINRTISDINSSNSSQADRIKMAKFDDGFISFTIIDVKPTDAGNYVNEQYNNVTTSQLLVVLEKPSQPVISVNTTAVLGIPLTLYCNSVSRSRPEYHNLTMYCNWTRNGQRLSPEEKQHILLEDKNLIINKVTLLDTQANFTCRCFDENGPVSDESEKAVFELEELSSGESHYWKTIVTVICVTVFVIIALVIGLFYRKKKTGIFGFRKNGKNTVMYLEGNEVNRLRPPEIGTKAAALLGNYEMSRRPSRRKSGKIVGFTEDRVVFKVVTREIDT